MNIRVGLGYDVHQLEEGRAMWLGGIQFDSKKGAVGHSDADVLIHAICDAILGASGMRDIGFHFPNTDHSFAGIDSKKLLAIVIEKIKKQGFQIGNIDATVIAELPKINPRLDEMKKVLADVMNIDGNQIGIKATTSEKVGFVGREEGIEAQAVALLYKI